jgi:hypothetical protein
MPQFQNFVPIDASTDLEAIISVKFGGLVGSVVMTDFMHASDSTEYYCFCMWFYDITITDTLNAMLMRF